MTGRVEQQGVIPKNCPEGWGGEEREPTFICDFDEGERLSEPCALCPAARSDDEVEK